MKTLLSLAITMLFCMVSLAQPFVENPDPQDFDTNNHYQTKTNGFGVGMFPKKGTLTMNLLIDNYSNKSILVVMKDKKGTTYFSELIGRRERRSWLKINMEALKDDVYEVTILNGKDKVIREINLRTLKVPLPEPKMEEQRLISML